MTAPDDMLDCPFCGSADVEALTGPAPHRWGTRCNDCDVWRDDRCDTKAEAIALWNTRKPMAQVLPWAKLGAAVMEGWPEGGDIDGWSLQDMAVQAGVLVEVEGGFDPERHEDSAGFGAEPGDQWFTIASVPSILRAAE